MIPIEELINNLFSISIWSLAKAVVLAALAIYIVFSLMVVREVDSMNKTLKGVFNLPIWILAWVHALFSIIIFILAFMIL